MKNKILFFFFLLFITTLSACTSKINKTNFDRIQKGMTYEEVVAILGDASSSSTITLGNTTGTSAEWKNRNGIISIQFFNGQVKIKQFIQGVSTPREDRW